MTAPIVVVGGGLVGLGTALALRKAMPQHELVVLEKEREVGTHQSGRNSGVLHAGLYYKPGSAKARLAVEGIRRMVAFCRDHSIPHDMCGKLVVATTPAEIPRLKALHERGVANGLAGLAWLEPAAAREIEPHVRCVAALRVPEEGIVDYPSVSRRMAHLLREDGVDVQTGVGVEGLVRDGTNWQVETTRGARRAAFVVNCAGLQSDRIVAMSGQQRAARIMPFRGEYFVLKPEAQHLVRHLIYPVPDPAFPFLGVHFTRLIHGGIECGPNAVLALKREGYRKTDVSLADTLDSLGYSGLWRFLRRYPSMVRYELWRSFSRAAFARSLQQMVPAVEARHLAPGGAGVRAQAMTPDGGFVEDFLFQRERGILHVVNAPSPGATASLSIGEEIARQIAEGMAA